MNNITTFFEHFSTKIINILVFFKKYFFELIDRIHSEKKKFFFWFTLYLVILTKQAYLFNEKLWNFKNMW